MKKTSFGVSLSPLIVSLCLCLLAEVSLVPRSLRGQPANDPPVASDFPPFLYTTRRDIGCDQATGLAKLREWLSNAAFAKSNREARLKARVAGEDFSPTRLNATQAQLETQWDLAGKTAVKIMIREEGWYRITQPELVAAGLDPGVNPRRLQLYADGQEQAIIVKGAKDGRFNRKDEIEFYGTGMDTPYTDARIYWLIEGSGPGKRIKAVQGSGGTPSPTSFSFTVKQKERSYYFAALKNGEAENFFGPYIYDVPVDQVLNVTKPALSPSLVATLEVALQGATDVPHRVKIFFNETELGEATFLGQDRDVKRFSVSQADVIEGPNRVTLAVPGPVNELNPDISFVDYVQLTYGHTFTADGNALRLEAQGGQRVKVKGFTNSGIRVFDITDPRSPVRLQATVQSVASGYSVAFTVPGSGNRTLLAFAGDTVKSPGAMALNGTSTWHETQAGHDFVIITHAAFLQNLQPLKELRESQGLSVALVDVEDLYDEFNFGAKTPYAIKDFLQRTTSEWLNPPRFVLLVGEASIDPRNYLGFGDLDFVPTKIVETFYLETGSDDWFVDLNEDGFPEIAVGRLPVRTADETTLVVSKIMGYEASSGMKEALFVADETGGFDYDYLGAIGEIELLVPADQISVDEVFRSESSDYIQVREALLNALNQGHLFVNYLGDGAVGSWGDKMFYWYDARALTNGMRLPFFINMTSFNGAFFDPYNESLAEALLKAPQGGAVSVWASTGLTHPSGQVVMNEALIRLLFNEEDLTLGEAAARAKSAVTDQDTRRTWIFFGDPTTKLKRQTE